MRTAKKRWPFTLMKPSPARLPEDRAKAAWPWQDFWASMQIQEPEVSMKESPSNTGDIQIVAKDGLQVNRSFSANWTSLASTWVSAPHQAIGKATTLTLFARTTLSGQLLLILSKSSANTILPTWA